MSDNSIETPQEIADWIEDAREFLNEDHTEHLYERAVRTDDVHKIKRLVKKAKAFWATYISEADQLLNRR